MAEKLIGDETPQRHIGTDFVRGVSILLMVFGHVDYAGTSKAFQDALHYAIYTFHMPLLLVLSGFYFNLQREPKHSLGKSMRRIGVPYLVFMALYLTAVPMANSLGIHTTNHVTCSAGFFFQTLFLRPMGAFWFLYTLFIFQVVISLTRLVAKRGRTNSSLWVWGTAFILVALTRVPGLGFNEKAVFFLAVGCLLRRLFGEMPGSLFALPVVLCVFLTNRVDEIMSNAVMQLVLVLSLLIFLIGLANATSERMPTRIISNVGRNSMAILVFHAFFVNLLKPVSGAFVSLDPSGFLFSGFATVFAVLGSIFAVGLCDRMKVSRMLFGVEKLLYPLWQRRGEE
jgi:fucose 4-O-acetylase-like acetyltransferase